MLDAIAEYGSVIALTYVASQRTFYGYSDMADAKSMLESIARSFGYIYGRENARTYQHHLTEPHRHNRWQGHQGD